MSTPRWTSRAGKAAWCVRELQPGSHFFGRKAFVDKTHQFWTPRISTAEDGRLAAVHLGAVEAAMAGRDQRFVDELKQKQKQKQG
jgi:hypothetical protein